MRAVIQVYPGENLAVCFVGPNGERLTVHTKDGELRICGSETLTARNVHHDVIGISLAPAGALAGR
jgi:hypothetical protein